MAQRNPEDRTVIEQVLGLVHQLSAIERKKLLEVLTIEELGAEVQKGIDAADAGKMRPAEDVFSELRRRNAARTDETE